MNQHELKQLYDLITFSIEGVITPEQFAALKAILRENPEAVQYYTDYMSILSDIRSSDYFLDNSGSEQELYDQHLWDKLSEHEKTAPTVHTPQEQPQRDLIQKVEHPRVDYKVSRGTIVSIISAAAAVVFIVLFAKFAPPKSGIEVATLTDSINAKWANIATPIEKGTRITQGNERLLLREGYAELLFDTNARIVVEAPAEFQILAEDRIGLTYGKVYAMVPKEAIGFSVYTQNAKIIDMGTEFGVETDFRGNTHLHVLKGKTMLIAGRQSDKTSMEVTKGEAKNVSAVFSEISDIPCDSDLFVRNIDSKVGLAWKGQNHLDLADIVGGGNGFGTGTIEKGIDPITGRPSKAVTNDNGPATNEYHPVPSNPYIDGVFIPNGRTQQIVSSQGHIFQECPISSGDWYISFDNVMRQNPTGSDSPYVPCITQHANMGVTYDLQTIRSLLLSEVNIVRFQSKCGVGKETDRPCNADFWVLVDGKVRYKKTQVKEKNKFFTIDIELSEKDRFLTLVTTDGQDPEDRVFDGITVSTIDSDWCRFADPILVLK